MTEARAPSPGARPAGPPRPGRLTPYLGQAAILEEGGPPRALTHLMMVACAFVIGVLIWAGSTKMQEITSVPGQVMPAGSIHAVQHLEGGIIAAILAEEGAVVEAGQPLIRLQPVAARSELDQTRTRRAALLLKAERLRAFVEDRAPDFSAGAGYPELVADQRAILETQVAAMESQAAVLNAQIDQRRAELKALGNRANSLEGQVAVVDTQLDMRRELLAKGLASRLTFLETKRALIRLQGDLATVTANRTAAGDSITEAKRKLVELGARLKNDALGEIGRVSTELAQLTALIAKLKDRARRLVITAPVRGIVKQFRAATIGAVVAPGETLMEIVPMDDEMVVEGRILPRDIGHVKIGQEVSVKISTYEYTRYGDLTGRVRKISASTFQDRDRQPYYKAIVVLDRNYVGDDPDRNPVFPGMVVQADIKTGAKTLLEYLLRPVYRSLDRAFSER